MEHLPGWACPQKEENERLPPPIPGEEASIGYGQKIIMQGQGQRITWEVQLKVLNATWVEVAEVNIWGCVTSCCCAVD